MRLRFLFFKPIRKKTAKKTKARPHQGRSKLVTAGIIFFSLWFLAVCTCIVDLFIINNLFQSVTLSASSVFQSPLLLLLVGSVLLGVLAFVLATLCLSVYFTKSTKDFASSLKGKVHFFRYTCLLVLIFPFYLLKRLIRYSKSVKAKARILPITTAIFVLLVFIPIWLVSYLSIAGISIYGMSTVLGYSPIPQPIAGTGSMYPTFPKGTEKTDKENAEQTVVTPLFIRYPGGIELFGKRYFNHRLERGDIIMFQNKMTEEFTKKQYGGATGYVKRVIALPGDTVELRGGVLSLNGKPLKEPYTASPHATFAEEFLSECKRITVPTGKVFVMGDNRKGSGDSREFGFIDFNDVKSVLTLNTQKGKWDKNWRDTSSDFDEASKIKINKEKYLALLNEKRKAAGVPLLTYSDKLAESAHKRGEIILKFDDSSFTATRSGYTMLQAMNEVGYFNPLYGESPSQGYFSADELIDNQFAFPESQKFLLDKDYDDVGIAEVEGEINGCPTQILVQHFAGYVPPNYNQADVKSWQEALANLREIQPGWAELKNKGDFYQQHKAEIDRITDLLALRMAHVFAVSAKMEANLWLNAEEQAMMDQDKALADEINTLADTLNSL